MPKFKLLVAVLWPIFTSNPLVNLLNFDRPVWRDDMGKPPREIPGYRWDGQQKRYFLITASHPAPYTSTRIDTPMPLAVPPQKHRVARDEESTFTYCTPKLINHVRRKDRQNFKALRYEFACHLLQSLRNNQVDEREWISSTNSVINPSGANRSVS